jgi:hypothetical protein
MKIATNNDCFWPEAVVSAPRPRPLIGSAYRQEAAIGEWEGLRAAFDPKVDGIYEP